MFLDSSNVPAFSALGSVLVFAAVPLVMASLVVVAYRLLTRREAVDGADARVATVGQRLATIILDVTAVVLLSVACLPVGDLRWGEAMYDSDEVELLLSFLMVVVVPGGYYLLSLTQWSTTPGKRVLYMWVQSLDGNVVTFRRALGEPRSVSSCSTWCRSPHSCLGPRFWPMACRC